MYFLYKEGIYGHGIFWIGPDKVEGMRQADEFASKDDDSYHKWNLYLFIAPTNLAYEDGHEFVYKGVRKEPQNERK